MPSKIPEAVFPPTELREIVYEVVELLKDRGETISCGETAAGGLISAAILSVPGASAVYKGGLTLIFDGLQLYTLESRLTYGGWTQEQIDNFTGPSIHCVLGLAEHVRGQLGSTYTVAESGSAGPSNWGKSDNMKAGYVALAVASSSGCVEREIETGLVDRDANMVRFAVEALRLVKDVIAADMARFSGWLNC
ncbi:putative competence damage-inducible protein [Diplodia seriata]|uniref:Putative competence damage-inducible protein n=1 Tax=Diplodia seriata TaxID=420778 RepID=A0A0G2EI92_9PEZI|nr:putative competence damage-inducible protein [Diplodia seriata]